MTSASAKLHLRTLYWDLEMAESYYYQEKNGKIAKSNWGDFEAYALDVILCEKAIKEFEEKYVEYLL